MRQYIPLLAFMFYLLTKQFSGERSAVLYVCTAVVVSMEIPLAAPNAHTHAHATESLHGCNVAR